MNEVQPIKDLNDVTAIQNFFTKHQRIKMACLVQLGCNVALRITDLLSIKFSDIEDNLLVLKEQKTGKTRKVTLNDRALSAIHELQKHYPKDEYLFQSNGNRVQLVKPFSRQYVSNQLKEVAEACHLSYPFNTHSLRKTFGYHAYKGGVDIHLLQKLFNHSSSTTTFRYIGITDERVRDVYELVSI